MTGRSKGAVLALGLAVAAGGCAGSVQEAVRGLGASDLECPLELTTPWIIEPGRYDVRGCGRHREYVCRVDSQTPSCSGSGKVEAQALRLVKPGAHSPALGVEAALASVSPQVLACAPGVRRVEVPHSVLAGHTVEGIMNGETPIVGQQADCMVKAIVSAGIPDKLDAIDVRFPDEFTFTREAPSAKPSAAVAPPVPTGVEQARPVEAPPPPASDDLEPRLRALVDQHAAAIVACAGKSPVAVEASYDGAGTVTLSLRGDSYGTAENRCVSAALGPLTIPSGSRSGVVIHLVR